MGTYQDLVERHRVPGLATIGHHTHFLAVATAGPRVCLDVVAVQLGTAPASGVVPLGHLAKFELPGQLVMDLVVLGHHDHSGRVAIQSMHNARSKHAADVTE